MERLLIVMFLIFGIFSCNKEKLPLGCTLENPCENTSIKVLNTIIGGEPLVLIYSDAKKFYQSFSRKSENGDILEFEVVTSNFPIIMKDQDDNQYDIFGNVVKGVSSSLKLEPVHSGIGYWFVWSSIFPEIIYNDAMGTGQNLTSNDPDWEINKTYVNRGAASDAIPALNFPEFKVYNNKDIITSSLLKGSDEIIIVRLSNHTRIYPIKILNYHEIVNDTLAGVPIVVCYAPYTHTSSVWKRNINNLSLEFGVSGRIYNNNILLFDRTTSSLWNQLLEKSVNGSFQGTQVERISYLRTTWSTWQETSDSHNILVGDEEMGLDYTIDPLGDYNVNHDYLPFEISNHDRRLKTKESVYGIEVNGEVVAFKFF